MDSLPIDVLSHIASYGNSCNLSSIYDIDINYSSACMIQRWWRNLVLKNGSGVRIICKQDSKVLYGILQRKIKTSDKNLVWCVQICEEAFLHFKYIQLNNDPNYILCYS